MERLRRRRAALACLALLFTVCAVYLSDYYRAGDAAVRAMISTEDVRVTDEVGSIAFDGPGEDAALAFYPGAKVAPEAYSPLMRMIAERGVDAWLIKAPLNLALLDTDAAGRLMAAHEYPRWYVVGHSMGGVAASWFAGQHPGEVEGLILLASYPTSKLPEGLKLLSVYGDRDGVLNLDNYEQHRHDWPEDARECVIEGGNHAGFGDYGPQKGDGAPGITAEAQQAETAARIAELCRGE